jgi:hypothetical protein
MATFQTILELPDWILQGINNGDYVRIGGVIRDAKTKQIIALLREVSPNMDEASTLLSQLGSCVSFLNLGVSILNLGVSVIGFTLVLKRLNEIEQFLKQELSKIQQGVDTLHWKFDISVYANFSAALDLAKDATTMIQSENRRSMATLAINRFLEAQHTFDEYVKIAIEENNGFADKYINSLLLAYLARTRCYLELEEINSAISCLTDGDEILSLYIKRYVESIISKPIDITKYRKFDLERQDLDEKLRRIYNWLEKDFSIYVIRSKSLEERVFNKMLPLIPSAMVASIPLVGQFMVNKEEMAEEVAEIFWHELLEETRELKLFSWELDKVEQVIETYNRFRSYLLEVQYIQQKGINFQEWLQLSQRTEIKQEGAKIMFIISSDSH